MFFAAKAEELKAKNEVIIIPFNLFIANSFFVEPYYSINQFKTICK
ncbi:hypothetical protein VCHA29O37_160047 [Vibrio chagasii]|nr:hypothetical protein VCHA29O37_160047 [Vibrio chagasii]